MKTFKGRIHVYQDFDQKPGTLALYVNPLEGQELVEMLKDGVLMKVTPEIVDGAAVENESSRAME